MNPPAGPARQRAGPGGVRVEPLPAPLRRWRLVDRGSATAELAAGLPVLLVLLLAGLTAVGAVTAQLQCVDAARDAVLAASRGEPSMGPARRSAPAGAEVTVTRSGDTVIATVRAPVPLLGGQLPRLRVSATAVAAVEPGSPGPAP
jgi:Flp pilus assembly protein TadG